MARYYVQVCLCVIGLVSSISAFGTTKVSFNEDDRHVTNVQRCLIPRSMSEGNVSEQYISIPRVKSPITQGCIEYLQQHICESGFQCPLPSKCKAKPHASRKRAGSVDSIQNLYQASESTKSVYDMQTTVNADDFFRKSIPLQVEQTMEGFLNISKNISGTTPSILPDDVISRLRFILFVRHFKSEANDNDQLSEKNTKLSTADSNTYWIVHQFVWLLNYLQMIVVSGSQNRAIASAAVVMKAHLPQTTDIVMKNMVFGKENNFHEELYISPCFTEFELGSMFAKLSKEGLLKHEEFKKILEDKNHQAGKDSETGTHCQNRVATGLDHILNATKSSSNGVMIWTSQLLMNWLGRSLYHDSGLMLKNIPNAAAIATFYDEETGTFYPLVKEKIGTFYPLVKNVDPTNIFVFNLTELNSLIRAPQNSEFFARVSNHEAVSALQANCERYQEALQKEPNSPLVAQM